MANPENGGDDMQEQWLFRNRKKSPRLFRQFFLGITRWKSTGFSSPLDRWRWDDEVYATKLKVWEWLVWHFEGAYKTARRSRKGDSRRKTEKKPIVSESTLFVFFEVASPWPFFGLWSQRWPWKEAFSAPDSLTLDIWEFNEPCPTWWFSSSLPKDNLAVLQIRKERRGWRPYPGGLSQLF